MTRATSSARAVAAVGALFALGLASSAAADDTGVLPGPPADPAAIPPVPAPAPATPRPPGVELHGVVVPWWIPWSQEAPTQATDALRLRFAVLRVDARPAPKLSVIARLGLQLPGSPLLDLAATYQLHPAAGITFGQFRLPLGAAATTLAPQLVMLDRPRYVYAMTKQAFRDVGVMVHSGPAGLADGTVHYRLAIASGNGRFGSGLQRAPEDGEYLVAARAMADVGRRLLGARDRLLVGASFARSHDPGIATGTAAGDRALAAHHLGTTLAPFGEDRATYLAGADLTLATGPLWAQAETMYLRSRASDGSAVRRALGLSVETGYTLPLCLPFDVQLAARIEYYDPDRGAAHDAQGIGALGVNMMMARLRWSVFGSITRFRDATTGAVDHGGELAIRAVATF